MQYRRMSNRLFALLSLCCVTYMTCFVYLLWDDDQSPYSIQPYVLGDDGQTFYEDSDLLSSTNIVKNITCKERVNFVFIKGMRCATTTLAAMFYRFGYHRNLTFVTPVDKHIYLNWPYPMDYEDFYPSRKGYNILASHAVYSKNFMRSIMPQDTVYISIIREPFSHLQSVFHYFNLANISGVPKHVQDPLAEYFTHLDKYEAAYMQPGVRTRWCIPDHFSLTKNLMSHCLRIPVGLPFGSPDITSNLTALNVYIESIKNEFSLIMLVEYFHESLILLRRLMCWQFKDIIFIRNNAGSYKSLAAKEPKWLVEKYKNISSADFHLYDYFNRTLWRKISQQGPHFFQEVQSFKEVEAKVTNFCQNVYKHGQHNSYKAQNKLLISKSAWTSEFIVNAADCWMLGPDSHLVQQKIQAQYAKGNMATSNQRHRKSKSRKYTNPC